MCWVVLLRVSELAPSCRRNPFLTTVCFDPDTDHDKSYVVLKVVGFAPVRPWAVRKMSVFIMQSYSKFSLLSIVVCFFSLFDSYSINSNFVLDILARHEFGLWRGVFGGLRLLSHAAVSRAEAGRFDRHFAVKDAL